MKDMKIKIESPEHSKQVQEALFALGYRWVSGRDVIEDVLDFEGMYTRVNGWITETRFEEDYFNESELPQHWLHSDGEFYDYREEVDTTTTQEVESPSVVSLAHLFKYVCESGNTVRIWKTDTGVNFDATEDRSVDMGGYVKLSKIITDYFTDFDKRAKIQQEIDEKKAAIIELELQMEELG